jgi:hypothetical protein
MNFVSYDFLRHRWERSYLCRTRRRTTWNSFFCVNWPNIIESGMLHFKDTWLFSRFLTSEEISRTLPQSIFFHFIIFYFISFFKIHFFKFFSFFFLTSKEISGTLPQSTFFYFMVSAKLWTPKTFRRTSQEWRESNAFSNKNCAKAKVVRTKCFEEKLRIIPIYVHMLILGPLCQGCQMVYFQTKHPNLSKFWRA